MKNRYIIPVIFFLCLLISRTETKGQDMNYSQYFSTPIYSNPAFTGLNTGLRARFLFRDQWPSLPSPFKSYYFSADLGDRNLPGSGGIGLMINQDTPGAGLIKNFGAALTVGVRIPINEFMVSQLGIKAGIMQRTVNWGDLVFTDQLSSKYGNIYQSSFIPPDQNQRTVPDFAVGGILQFQNPNQNVNGNLGFSVDHIFQPDVSYLSTGSSAYPRKYSGLLDVVISTGPGGSTAMMRSSDEPLKVNLGALYQNQGGMGALQIGINLLKYNIYLGSWYKTTMSSGVTNNVVALVAGYRYNLFDDMNLKFMYSYDLQVSGQLNGTGGAHEISIVLELDKFSIFGGGGGGGYYPGGRRGGGALECPTFY